MSVKGVADKSGFTSEKTNDVDDEFESDIVLVMMKSAGNIYTVTLLCTQATVAAYDICKLIGVKHNFQTGDK